MNFEIDYDLLANKIAEAQSLMPSNDEVIWDKTRCAKYLNTSDRNFLDRIAKRKGFPNMVPSGRGWRKVDVVRWALKKETARQCH